MKIFTIGYEGATMDAFLATLREAGVEQVIDVRALPLSRRPGFSKNILAATLKDSGIGYIHLKALGTPKPGRDAAKKGDWRTMERVYAGMLKTHKTPAAALRAAQIEMLKQKQWQSPYYWAGFVLQGEWN